MTPRPARRPQALGRGGTKTAFRLPADCMPRTRKPLKLKGSLDLRSPQSRDSPSIAMAA